MRRGSLRLRLIAAASAAIVVALVLAGIGLTALFERHIARRLDVELEGHLRRLAAGLSIKSNGAIPRPSAMVEPRFREPYGGFYWQIADETSGASVQSRSLWDRTLKLPRDRLAKTAIHRHILDGPQGARLIALERWITLRAKGKTRKLRLVVAVDRRELTQARAAFAAVLAPSLGVLALVLIAATWLQVSVGLRPLDALRRALQGVRAGREARLVGSYPDEVMPLVADLNELLEAQEATLARARNRAGDLAHGLKTPLTVLAADARRLRKRGQTKIATEIEDVARNMHRHIERELALARIRGPRPGTGGQTALKPIVDRLVRILRRTPAGERLSWQTQVAAGLVAPIDADDLAELLGNLLDNAVKWALGAVSVTVARVDGEIAIAVEDDGPGVGASERARIVKRGRRLDRSVQGSGLGLAIIGDILEVYGGRLELGVAGSGGLRATLMIPATPAKGKAPGGT